MPLPIPPGQFYSGLIDGLLWVLVGGWLLYIWPNRIRRKIEQAELSEEDGTAKLRKVPPKLGYVLMLVGIGLMMAELEEVGFFGNSKFRALLPFSISLILVVFWLRQRRKDNQ